MPHITVKLVSGRSEEQKSRLAEAITREAVAILDTREESVSVAFEEFALQDWAEKVYRADIQSHWADLYKKPGYDPFAPKELQ
jgi:4-oxalocrotonate tautomerase